MRSPVQNLFAMPRRFLLVFIPIQAAFVVLAIYVASMPSQLSHDLFAWGLLMLLLAFTEHSALSFHEERAEFSLSAAEAVLFVMIVTLSLPQVVMATITAHLQARGRYWLKSIPKGIFYIVS